MKWPGGLKVCGLRVPTLKPITGEAVEMWAPKGSQVAGRALMKAVGAFTGPEGICLPFRPERTQNWPRCKEATAPPCTWALPVP